jgi:hypothetical protein
MVSVLCFLVITFPLLFLSRGDCPSSITPSCGHYQGLVLTEEEQVSSILLKVSAKDLHPTSNSAGSASPTWSYFGLFGDFVTRVASSLTYVVRTFLNGGAASLLDSTSAQLTITSLSLVDINGETKYEYYSLTAASC